MDILIRLTDQPILLLIELELLVVVVVYILRTIAIFNIKLSNSGEQFNSIKGLWKLRVRQSSPAIASIQRPSLSLSPSDKSLEP